MQIRPIPKQPYTEVPSVLSTVSLLNLWNIGGVRSGRSGSVRVPQTLDHHWIFKCLQIRQTPMWIAGTSRHRGRPIAWSILAPAAVRMSWQGALRQGVVLTILTRFQWRHPVVLREQGWAWWVRVACSGKPPWRAASNVAGAPLCLHALAIWSKAQEVGKEGMTNATDALFLFPT